MSREALALAYYYPPLGGAGVQRTIKFLKYLPEFGWDATVVTGPTGTEVDWTPPDETLVGAIPHSVRVARVPGPEPTRTTGWRARAERWLRVPEPFSRWWVRSAIEAGVSQRSELVYASMSPFESGTAAAAIAARLGVPWVADLRDPWALDEWVVYPTRVHRQLELRRMRSTLASAAAIVMNTPEATAQLLAHFPELGERPVVTIPNGFDSADFDRPAPQRDDSVFKIVHAGYVHAGRGRRDRRTKPLRRILGGAVPGLDVLTRSHLFLLDAVERAGELQPSLADRLEVHLAGTLSAHERARLPRFVHAHGYLPHRETVELLRGADLLFLPMHDLPEGFRARIVPGKTYEYLAAGPPILGALPDGDARDLLEQAGTAILCRPADVECMARGIVRAANGGGPRVRPAAGVLAAYERRELTRKLAGVFDDVAG